MIPKIIHYCWFGRGKMPRLANQCYDSWKLHLPEYEYMLWNEDTFDVNSNRYTKEAYDHRKFAFVTDYVRLYALQKYGGIYMDTDVEVVKSFNDLLHLPAFSGFESPKYVPTGIMASEKGGLWVNQQIKHYDDRPFILPDGTPDTTTNTYVISKSMANAGLLLNNTYQVCQGMHFFPKDYFSPRQYGKVRSTANTYCIHHFAGSWNPPARRFKIWFFRTIVGGTLTEKLVLFKRWLLGKLRLQKNPLKTPLG